MLRYEKRTKECAAKLMAAGLTNFTVQQETIADAANAVGQLRGTAGFAPQRVFVLGHSLGGTVAPRIAEAAPHIADWILKQKPAR